MANSTGRKAGRNCDSPADKKRVNKVGAKEVVQCSNDNYFLGLDADIAFAGSPFSQNTIGDMALYTQPNIVTNKSNKTLCIQMPEILLKKYANC